jgi:signal transduction histidine kinase
MPVLAESGPGDVRHAIRAFNDMQQRLSRHAAEQTYMIAAITHDLQTPMTRLRLKLEQMDDLALQKRLLADWRAMRGVVEEGLELARSTGRDEEPVLLDIDSLIHSIVEDEREAGHVASFDVAAGCDWRCRPGCCAAVSRIWSIMPCIMAAAPIFRRIAIPMDCGLSCVILVPEFPRISWRRCSNRWSASRTPARAARAGPGWG